MGIAICHGVTRTLAVDMKTQLTWAGEGAENAGRHQEFHPQSGSGKSSKKAAISGGVWNKPELNCLSWTVREKRLYGCSPA
jgi:hypothetical protein